MRRLVVLRLGKEIGGDKSGIGGSIGEDDDLGGARDHVDADDAKDTALRRRDIGVAGPDDLEDGRNGLRPIGERGDRLRPADPVDFVDAGDPRRSQHQRIDRAVRRRHNHGDARAARHFRRHSVHHHRGGIACRAARHIKPDRLDRAPAPAELDPERIDKANVGGPLAQMVVGHPPVGELERLQRSRLASRDRGVDLAWCDPEALRFDVDPIETARVVGQRLVAARTHVGNDGCNRFVHLDRGLALGAEQRLEAPLEIRRPHIELNGHPGPL